MRAGCCYRLKAGKAFLTLSETNFQTFGDTPGFGRQAALPSVASVAELPPRRGKGQLLPECAEVEDDRKFYRELGKPQARVGITASPTRSVMDVCA